MAAKDGRFYEGGDMWCELLLLIRFFLLPAVMKFTCSASAHFRRLQSVPAVREWYPEKRVSAATAEPASPDNGLDCLANGGGVKNDMS